MIIGVILLVACLCGIFAIFSYLFSGPGPCSSGLGHDYEWSTDLFTCGDEKVLICKKCRKRKE